MPDAPAVPAPAPAAPPPAVTADTFRQDAASVTPDQLNALLRAAAPSADQVRAAAMQQRSAQLVAPPPADPAAAAAPAEPAAPPAPVEAAAPPAEPDADPEKALDGARNWRVRANDFQEAEVFRLMKTGLSLKDASAKVFGQASAPAAPTLATPAPVEAPPPTAEVDAQIAALEAEVVALDAKANEALDKEADTKTAMKFTKDGARKETQIQFLKQHRQTILQSFEQSKVDSEVGRFQQARQVHIDKVRATYAVLNDVNSPERAMFNQRVQAMREDPALSPILQSPNWPMIVARELAEEHGWKRASAPAPVAAAAPPAPALNPPPASAAARATAASVITPGQSAQGATFTPTKDSLLEAARTARPEELNALLGKPPGRR